MKNKFAKGRDARETMRRVLLILGSRMTPAAADMMPSVRSSETLSAAAKGKTDGGSLSRGLRSSRLCR
jgi:hypothetical protein